MRSRQTVTGYRGIWVTGCARAVPRHPVTPILRYLIPAVLLALACTPARADDPEGCLYCHQYRGLARVRDGQNISMFYADPNYYSRGLGPHARLRCTDCHVREEVERTPHKPVSPVDCTRTCHLAGPGNVEKRFAHDRVSKMLRGSIHGEDTLKKSNEILGSPLRANQSQCLLCHDEPTFRRNGDTWAATEAPIERCAVCHDNRPAADNRFQYWHMQARSHPARSKIDEVRTCATCHADPGIRKQFNMPDTAVSYLASFHGKAVLLGNEQTAGCLDCHVGEMQNVHQIMSRKEAGAPTNPANLPNTCRTPQCHRDAGAAISTAAMHVDLTTSRGTEYFIAFVFIVLIIFTFGPSLLLTALKLLQIVVGRQDPNHHHHEELAKKLMADPVGRQKLKRFNPHQRAQHWLLVIFFGTLCISGFPMKFADYRWAQWVIHLFGGLTPTRIIHRVAGVGLIAGMIYHMIYIAISLRKMSKATGKGWIKTFLSLPLVMQPRDLIEMNKLVMYLVGLRKTPPQSGRFSPEEKFEYFGVFWGSMLLGLTGAMMWANSLTTQYLPGRVLTVALLIHTFEAFLALLHVGVLHIAGVVFTPTVAPISPAMFTGDTPPAELAEEHGELVEQVARELGMLDEHHKHEDPAKPQSQEVAHA